MWLTLLQIIKPKSLNSTVDYVLFIFPGSLKICIVTVKCWKACMIVPNFQQKFKICQQKILFISILLFVAMHIVLGCTLVLRKHFLNTFGEFFTKKRQGSAFLRFIPIRLPLLYLSNLPNVFVRIENCICIGLHISFEGALPKHIWRVFLGKKGRGMHF